MLGKEEKPSYLYVKQVKVKADIQLHRNMVWLHRSCSNFTSLFNYTVEATAYKEAVISVMLLLMWNS